MTAALTLERRVTLWSAMIVGLSLLICGGGGAWFLHHQAVGQLDRQLRQVAEQFFEQKRLHGGPQFDLRNAHEIAEWLPAPGAETIVEIEQKGVLFFRSPGLGRHGIPSDGGSFRFARLPRGRMRVGSLTQDDTTIRMAAPAGRVQDLVRNLVIVFAVGSPLAIALVIAGGRLIARQALVPVQEITRAADAITAAELGSRVPVPVPPDEVRRLALVLNSTLDRLEKSFLQAQRFTADASHELKTPLTVLHADLEALLGSSTLGDDDRMAVASALHSVQRLSAITNNLLLLASADAGRLELSIERVNLAGLLRDCLDDARIVAEAAGISLAADPLPIAPVEGEPIRLRQIISNLLDNAVKFNRPGGRIHVSLAVHGGVCALRIGNTGLGISAEHRPHLFKRFHRGAHHAGIPGHGLGLSLARELALAHGGSLELLASDATETVFQLLIPESRAVPRQEGARAVARLPVRGAERRTEPANSPP